MQGIVTPEAVVLQFETAGVGSRLIAALIDVAVRSALFIALLVASAVLGTVESHVGLAGVFISLFVVLFVYPVVLETVWRGRTVGKAVLGLRVVTVEGAPIRFRHAAIRGVLAIIDNYLLFGAIGVVAMLASANNQRLGDLVAGTVVLRERTAAAAPIAMAFSIPAGFEPYAATLDVSGLTAADYGAARSFLLRAPSLPPQRRAELAGRIALPMLERLRHTPPPGVGPEVLLACVAARVQQREAPHPRMAPTLAPPIAAPPIAAPPTLAPPTAASPTAASPTVTSPSDGFAAPA